MFVFNRSRKVATAGREVQKGEPLKFHPGLINQLKDYQDKIYADFKVLSLAVKSRDDTSLEGFLLAFKKVWHSYLMEKNVKLYSYLKHSPSLNAQQVMDVNGTRAKSNQLTRKLNRFLAAYIIDGKLDFRHSSFESLEHSLNDLGDELIASMRLERARLFPIYQNCAN